jgi:hypothetical protein
MPFGPYADFAECVADNQDKDNPEAFCTVLEEMLEGRTDGDETTMRFASNRAVTLNEETEPMVAEDTMTEDFHALIILEETWTGDGRYFETESLSWRDLPLPLMALDKTTEAHMEARLVGNFTRLERIGREIHGYGAWVQSDDPEVMRLQGLVQRGELRGISADLDDVEMEILVPNEEALAYDEDGKKVYAMEAPMMRFTAGRIMGATIVPFPALQEAFIESNAALTAALMFSADVTGHITMQNYSDIDFSPPQGAREEAERGLAWRQEFGRGGTEVGVARARDIANGRNLSPDTIGRMTSYFARHEVDKQGEGWSPGEDGFPSAGRIAWALWGGDAGRTWAEKIKRSMESRDEQGSMTAGGFPVEAPLCPPAAWFSDPGLMAPTPMTVTDDGRIFGHLATWESCHVGFADQCVRPPRSASAYAHFTTGEIITEDGTRFPVGQITMGTGHAPLNASANRAAAHYDDTGLAVADVRCGEDNFGIWMAGALRPDVEPLKIRALMASDVSGDWRRIGSSLELVGVLAVNVPGFPKLRETEGILASMVASLSPSAKNDSESLRKVADRIAATIGRSKADRVAELAAKVRRKDS